MPTAKKASKASQTKTARKTSKAAPVAKAKSNVLKLVANPKSKAPPGSLRAKPLQAKKPMAGEPRNVILELWKAKEEKHRNEGQHMKFHQTGPPNAQYAANHKHDKHARNTGLRRKV